MFPYTRFRIRVSVYAFSCTVLYTVPYTVLYTEAGNCLKAILGIKGNREVLRITIVMAEGDHGRRVELLIGSS